MTTEKSTKKHPWIRAAKTELVRLSSVTGKPESIDKGANFFVLALEALGAKPRFSCEGHPTGFYVAFEAGYPLAVQIEAAGYFLVEVAGPNYWIIRLPERNIESGKPFCDADRKKVLRWAVEAWLKKFSQELSQLA